MIVNTTHRCHTHKCDAQGTSVIHHVGAKIILIDIQKDSFEMDYDKLEKAITNKTKAIIPVDIAGIMVDYDRIFEIVNKKRKLFNPSNELQSKIGRVTIMADAAHSIGATYKSKKNGGIADFTCFSFHAVKNLTTAEGGSVTWNPKLGLHDEKIYKEFQLLSLHGQDKDALTKSKLGSWEYDIIYPGYKCNLTNIAAALGLAQLDRYEGLLKRRHEIIEMYNKKFLNSRVKYLNHNGSSAHLYITRVEGITLEQRNNIIEQMAIKGIACNVHYKPLPLLTAYKNLGFDIKNYPNALEFYENEITLPLHTLLSDEDIIYVADNLLEIIKGIK